MIPFSEHDMLLGPEDCLLWEPGRQTSPYAHPLAWAILPDPPRCWLAPGWPLSWQSPLRQSLLTHSVDPLGTIKAACVGLAASTFAQNANERQCFSHKYAFCWSGEKHSASLGNAGSVSVSRTHRVTTVMSREMERKMGQLTASSRKLATWQQTALQSV